MCAERGSERRFNSMRAGSAAYYFEKKANTTDDVDESILTYL